MGQQTVCLIDHLKVSISKTSEAVVDFTALNVDVDGKKLQFLDVFRCERFTQENLAVQKITTISTVSRRISVTN